VCVYIYIGISGLHAESLGLESLPFEGQSSRDFSQTFQKNDVIAHHKRPNVRLSSRRGTSESLHPEVFSDNHTVQTTVATSLLLFTAFKSIAECHSCYYCILLFYKTSYMCVTLNF